MVLLLLTGNFILRAEEAKTEWTSVSLPAIKEVYRSFFDSFGLTCNYKPLDRESGELQFPETRNGVARHADSVTMENEMKPDCIFGSAGKNRKLQIAKEKFSASNGKVIEVPVLHGLKHLDRILQACKDAGLVMRGHVLIWHSQTPAAFFAENYTPLLHKNMLRNPVDKATMTARQEWYIKTVLSYITGWEKKNNHGKRIVWAWDVVNEAVADDASKVFTGNNQQWLRGATRNTRNRPPSRGGSRWYQIYGSEEYIINAFCFAAAYAPEDVKLCYNDENVYMDWKGHHGSWKTSAILHLISLIRNAPGVKVNGKMVKPRLDVIGMESHVPEHWPRAKGYEAGLKRILAAGVDVHVTEFDIRTKSREKAAELYAEYFQLFKKYGKQYPGAHKIRNVTVWGIANCDSWISSGGVNFPLLFDRENKFYYPNKAFFSVISAGRTE